MPRHTRPGFQQVLPFSYGLADCCFLFRLAGATGLPVLHTRGLAVGCCARPISILRSSASWCVPELYRITIRSSLASAGKASGTFRGALLDKPAVAPSRRA